MDVGPGLAVLAGVALLWVEARLVAGRPTMPASRFLPFFAVGAVLVPTLSFAIERLALVLLPSEVVAYVVAPPVEEALLVLPLLLFAVRWDAGRSSIADLTLVAFATGLGFQFVGSTLFAQLAHDGPHFVSPAVAGWVRFRGTTTVNFTGFAVHAGLVGLAAGTGLRLRRRGPGAWVPAVSAYVLVSFVHAVFAWAVPATGSFRDLVPAAAVRGVYTITLHGMLPLILLVVGLAVASWVEARREGFEAFPELMTRGEGARPSVVVEWLVAARAAVTGAGVMALLELFRRRRALGLAIAAAARDPADPLLRARAESAARRAMESRWLVDARPPRRPPLQRVADVAAPYRRALVFAVASLLVLITSPASSPAPFYSLVYDHRLALGALIVTTGMLVSALARFRTFPRPSLVTDSADAAAAYLSRALLLAGAATAALAAMVGWGLAHERFFGTPQGTSMFGGILERWSADPVLDAFTLLALGAFVGCVDPDPPPGSERVSVWTVIANLPGVRSSEAARELVIGVQRGWPALAMVALTAFYDHRVREGVLFPVVAGLVAATAIVFRQRFARAFAPVGRMLPASVRGPALGWVVAAVPMAVLYVMRWRGYQAQRSAIVTVTLPLAMSLAAVVLGPTLGRWLAPLLVRRNQVLPRVARVALALFVPLFLGFLLVHRSLGDLSAFVGSATDRNQGSGGAATQNLIVMTAVLSVVSAFLLLAEPPATRRGPER